MSALLAWAAISIGVMIGIPIGWLFCWPRAWAAGDEASRLQAARWREQLRQGKQ